MYEQKLSFCPKNKQSQRNYLLNFLGDIFGVIFTVESVIKIIGMGFVLETGTYLRDGWNLVDFAVVFSWVCEIVLAFLAV